MQCVHMGVPTTDEKQWAGYATALDGKKVLLALHVPDARIPGRLHRPQRDCH